MASPDLGSTALQIVVRPWSTRPLLDPGRRALVPVAVSRTEAFDPTAAPARYRFGSPTAVAAGRGVHPVTAGVLVDVDGDGQDDLVLFFPTHGTGFAGDEETAMLAWDGAGNDECRLLGTDQIRLAKRYRWQRRTDGPESRRAPAGGAVGGNPSR